MGRKDQNENRTLLILDLDETLIHATKHQLAREPDFKLGPYFVYIRPYLSSFLQEVSKDFLLAVWSSASDDYIEATAQQIISPLVELTFIWGRSRCTYRRNFTLDERRIISDDLSDHYYFAKPLKKVRRQGYHLDRVLIVDDTPEKIHHNYGNAIYPRLYQGQAHDDEYLSPSPFS